MSGNELEIIVSGKVDDDEWIGIGFSDNPVMPETDIVLGFFDQNGNGVVKDYYTDNYIPPKEDDSQDIKETSLERKDGITTMRFKRSLKSSDTEVCYDNCYKYL